METMVGLKRTHSCDYLNKQNEGEEVVLCGWVARRRDHGGLIFIDLRDRSGFVQVVFSQEVDVDSFKKAEAVRSEYVLAVRGTVKLRDASTINSNMATGEIEVYAAELRILNAAKTPSILYSRQY
jgi:aspartyl-tRNA synthetase